MVDLITDTVVEHIRSLSTFSAHSNQLMSNIAVDSAAAYI